MKIFPRTWPEQDIVLEEVGYYSAYSELAGDNFEMRKDRSLLRQRAIPSPPDGIVPIHRRLQHVPAAELEAPPAPFQGDEAMVCLNRWLGLRVPDLNLQSFWQEVELITTNRILSQIMKIPYSTDTHGSNEWAFGAASVRGKIFVGYISREGFCYLSQNVPVQDQQAQDRAWTETSHRLGPLFNEYLVDMFNAIETDRLDFRHKQQKRVVRKSDLKRIRRDETVSAEGSLQPGRTYLTSDFLGSPRHQQKLVADALAIVKSFGKPTYSITMSCNPKWEEIIRELLPKQTAADRPDITARVFHGKLSQLFELLPRAGYLGMYATGQRSATTYY
ncbi:hypothetical protein RvY_00148 [Ramazzottius varieornatus]|uniref:Helitron helicase-like domain-containing protein n=1 Tax=Ramazzottius varieornatus TaxID=947166 RepID=A0A1D1UBP2_RAMVA|nr:hypothetical protein RvY_00148 [Ramazzottius varieornatus]